MQLLPTGRTGKARGWVLIPSSCGADHRPRRAKSTEGTQKVSSSKGEGEDLNNLMKKIVRDGRALCPPVFLFVAALFASTVWAQASTISYDKTTGQISVDVQQQPLTSVLAEIAKQTGVQIAIQPGLDRPVTARLSHISLDEGLARLLRHTSYALIYSSASGGEADRPEVLEQVQVLSLETGSSAVVTSAPVPRSFAPPSSPFPQVQLSPEEAQMRREEKQKKKEERAGRKDAGRSARSEGAPPSPSAATATPAPGTPTPGTGSTGSGRSGRGGGAGGSSPPVK